MNGEQLRHLRQRANVTATSLAEQLEICPSTLSRYENGRSPIPRKIELAARYVCEPSLAPQSAAERLIEAIQEVAKG